MGRWDQRKRVTNNILIVARPLPSSFSGMQVWSVAAAKCGSGVRVHGGNGKNSWNKSLVELWYLFVNQLHSLFVTWDRRSDLATSMLIMVFVFNDGEKGWPNGEGGFLSLCMYIVLGLSCHHPDREGVVSYTIRRVLHKGSDRKKWCNIVGIQRIYGTVHVPDCRRGIYTIFFFFNLWV